MAEYNQYFEANKSLWNQRTLVHRDSAFYNREGFLKGATVLTPIELAELTAVKGKKMLHLQCHFGMDSLDSVSYTHLDVYKRQVTRSPTGMAIPD